MCSLQLQPYMYSFFFFLVVKFCEFTTQLVSCRALEPFDCLRYALVCCKPVAISLPVVVSGFRRTHRIRVKARGVGLHLQEWYRPRAWRSDHAVNFCQLGNRSAPSEHCATMVRSRGAACCENVCRVHAASLRRTQHLVAVCPFFYMNECLDITTRSFRIDEHHVQSMQIASLAS